MLCLVLRLLDAIEGWVISQDGPGVFCLGFAAGVWGGGRGVGGVFGGASRSGFATSAGEQFLRGGA